MLRPLYKWLLNPRWPLNHVPDSPVVLIVDDTLTNLRFVESMLKTEGFTTLTAQDGATARRLSREKRPDLILLDVIMPDECGFETCAKLKSDPLTADIPIIFLSARNDVSDRVRGLKLGGVDYVSKPVHAEELLARTRVHLRISEVNRALAAQQRARMKELRNAQRAILTQPSDCPDARFGVHYESLEEAGGDIYDVVRIDPDVFGYFVADVSGHGAGAAFLTSAIKALLRQYSGPLYSPEDAMRGIESVMNQMLEEEQYLTASYARLNCRSHQVSVVSAGHPPPIVVTAEGKAHALEISSEPLGVFSSAILHRTDIHLRPGDRFYMYTDGMVESVPGAGRRKGSEELMQSCVRHRSLPVALSVAAIASDLLPPGKSVADDRMLLGVEIPA